MATLDLMRLKGDGWQSDSPAVDKLLKRLARRTRSESSRKNYLYTINRFCLSVNASPDEVVQWPRSRVEEAVQSWCDQYMQSPTVANTMEAHLISFFYANGFKSGKRSNLELEPYHVGARYRKTQEYIPENEEIRSMATKAGVSLRNRSAVLVLYTAGLRNSTARALRWDDLPELDMPGDDQPVYVPVYPEMKQVAEQAAKGGLPYFTFISKETVEALRNYKRWVKEKYGIMPGQVIFMTEDRRQPLDTRRFTPVSRKILQRLSKDAARSVGVQKWQYVRPHTFRKAFERALRNSGLDPKDQEFLMGHLVGEGSQDNYYDKTKIDELRHKYAKVKFFEDINREVQEELQTLKQQVKDLQQQAAVERAARIDAQTLLSLAPAFLNGDKESDFNKLVDEKLERMLQERLNRRK